MNTNAKLINRADAQFTFGNLTNSAMIVNYGNMGDLHIRQVLEAEAYSPQ